MSVPDRRSPDAGCGAGEGGAGGVTSAGGDCSAGRDELGEHGDFGRSAPPRAGARGGAAARRPCRGCRGRPPWPQALPDRVHVDLVAALRGRRRSGRGRAACPRRRRPRSRAGARSEAKKGGHSSPRFSSTSWCGSAVVAGGEDHGRLGRDRRRSRGSAARSASTGRSRAGGRRPTRTCGVRGEDHEAAVALGRRGREAAGVAQLVLGVVVEVDARHAERRVRKFASSAHGAAGGALVGARLPGGAGDVEVRPRVGLREARQEAGRGDGAAGARGRCWGCRRSWT